MSLPEALERAAGEFAHHADALRDANGDPDRLLETLSGEGASEVLAWLLGSEIEAGEELALAWCDNERGAEPLQALAEDGLAKPARKVLRKALHRLRSRGVALAASSNREVVARLPSIDETIEVALVSPLDPRGSRMGYLVASHPAGGARLYEALFDDVRGIIEFRAYDTGRSRARKFVRELSGGTGRSMIEVEPGTLRALIAQAASRQATDRPEPRAFTENRSQLSLERASTTPAEQVVNELGAGDADDGERIERVAERLASGELGPWPPSLEALRTASDPLRERAKSTLIVSGAADEERSVELLRGAAADLFDAEFSAVMGDRFRETAFVLWRSDKVEDARDCLAAAAALAGPTAEGAVPLAFARLWFGPMLEELANAPEEAEDGAAPAEENASAD